MALALSKNEILKTDFISNVSHEIKTPLANIKNYATLLKDPNLPQEKREEYSNSISATSQRLADLIINILKLSKLENQEIPLLYNQVNLQEVLEEIIVRYEFLLDDKNIDLNLSVDKFYMTTERSYMEIIFSNILSNAIKFSPINGKITILLNQSEAQTTFFVSDNGMRHDN